MRLESLKAAGGAFGSNVGDEDGLGDEAGPVFAGGFADGLGGDAPLPQAERADTTITTATNMLIGRSAHLVRMNDFTMFSHLTGSLAVAPGSICVGDIKRQAMYYTIFKGTISKSS
jgi:hypothetical protein